MRKIYSLFMITVVLLFSCVKSANDNTDAYKESDAVFIKLIKEYTLKEDGSIEYNYTHRLKYLSHNSFNRYFGETFVVYNPNFQELKVNKSETTMADGQKVQSPANAYNEVLPSFADKAPAFNHLREMVITHTGLELGAIVDLNYLLKTKPGYWPELMGNEELQSNMPYKSIAIIVKIPANKELKYELLNADVKPKISTSGNEKTYEWNFEDVKGISMDRQTSASSIPRLLFSTFTGIEDVPKYFEKLPIIPSNIPDEIKAKATSLTKDSKSNLEKALAIQHFVANDFNYWPVPMVQTGFTTRKIEEIWKSAGGNALEKTILMNAMLTSLGIESDPIAVLPAYYPKEMANLLCFNEFMVQIKTPEKENYYLSAIHDDKNDASVSVPDKLIFGLTDKTNTAITVSPLENKIAYKSEMVINASKEIDGNNEIILSNFFNPYFKLQANAEEASHLLPKASEAKIEELSRSTAWISGKIKKAKFDKVQANYYFLTLPSYSGGVNSWNLNVLPTERSSVLEFPCTVNESYSYSIKLPENLKLVSQAVDAKEENKLGKAEIKISFENGVVLVERKLQLTKNKIDVADYEMFRKIMVLWNVNKYKELVFKE